jgi:hypothetical protein
VLGLYGTLETFDKSVTPPELRRPLNPHLNLVDFQMRTDPQPLEELPRYLGFLNEARRTEYDDVKASFGAVLHQIVPHPVGFRLRRVGVLLTAKTKPSRKLAARYAERGWKWVVQVQPDRRALAKAVSRAFRYPRALMFADPAATARLLNGIRRVRMFATYGRPKSEDV